MASQHNEKSDQFHGQSGTRLYRTRSFLSLPQESVTVSLVDVIVVRGFKPPHVTVQQPGATNGATTANAPSIEIFSGKAVAGDTQSALPPPAITLSGPQDPGHASKSHPSGIRRQLLPNRNVKQQAGQGPSPAETAPQYWSKDRSLDAQKLANDLGNTRVLLFEYPEEKILGWELMRAAAETAKHLTEQIVSRRAACPKRPIVFICDQFGAIVIERCLMQCAQHSARRTHVVWVTVGIMVLQASGIPVELSGSYFEARNNWLRAHRGSGDKRRRFDKLVRRPTRGLRIMTTMEDKTAAPGSGHEVLERTQSPSASQRLDFGVPLSPCETTTANHSGSHEYSHKWHAEKFKDFYEWHAGWRPAMMLDRVLLNSHGAYVKAIRAIKKGVNAYRLLNAAQIGEVADLRALLLQFEDDNIRLQDLQDGMSRSALHISVRQGRSSMINVLAEMGDATFFSIQDKNGRNALHYAARYCLDRKMLNKIVGVLVERGVTLDAVDNEGLSARKAAANRNVHPKLLQQFPGPSLEIPMPPMPKKPDEMASATCRGFRATLAEFHSNTQGGEQVFIQQPSVYKLLYQEDGGPERFFQLGHQEPSDDRKISTGAAPFRWYHLPVNHVGWVKDLFARMRIATDPPEHDQHNGKMYWSRYMRPQARNFEYWQHFDNSGTSFTGTNPDQPKREGAKDFVLFIPYLSFERTDILEELQKATNDAASTYPHTAFAEKQDDVLRQRSSFLNAPASPLTDAGTSSAGGDSPLSAFSATSMSDRSDRDLSDDDIGVWSSDPGKRKMRTVKEPSCEVQNPLDLEKGLIRNYLAAPSSEFHQRRTLDQSHYIMLDKTFDRDDDQVVLRRQRGQGLGQESDQTEENDQSEKGPLRLVMVDQLWIWVIGNTVVSSFPQKWRTRDFKRECDVLDQLLLHLKDQRRPCVPTVYDLAHVIIKFCVSIFNRPEPRAELLLHSLFEESVGGVADLQMKLFRKFETEFHAFAESRKHNARSMDNMFAIEEDILLLDEVRDIRDELRMILRILHDQAMAVKDMLAIFDQSELLGTRLNPSIDGGHQVDTAQGDGQPTYRNHRPESAPWRRQNRIEEAFKKRYGVINANIRDFTRMLAHADNSYEEANSLLDLKQKQLNVLEARAARKGADTILIFTIATIIFGGLSFVTAFFALNVAAFPHQDGGVTTWKLKNIVGIIAAIAFSLTLPFIGAAIWINSLVHEMVQFFKSFSKWWTWVYDKIRPKKSIDDDKHHDRDRLDSV